jgi:hypothetical protein
MTVIAGRLCVDAHRRRGRTMPVAELDPGLVEADHGDVFAAVERAYLAQAMDALAPRHREVLDRREREGWSYQRIAEHYGVSLGTVEALLHRARKALRREYEKVAGDHRPWAAVPGLAWAGRRLHALRTRLSARAADFSDLATPLAAKVASAAMVLGTAAAVGHGWATAVGTAHPARATAPAVVRTAAATKAVVLTGTERATRAEGVAATGTAAAASSRPVTLGSARISDAATSQREASNDPVQTRAAGTGVSLDPGAVATDVRAHASNIEDQIRKRLP